MAELRPNVFTLITYAPATKRGHDDNAEDGYSPKFIIIFAENGGDDVMRSAWYVE